MQPNQLVDPYFRPLIQEPKEPLAIARAKVINASSFNSGSYEYEEAFKPYDPREPLSARTTADLLHVLETRREVDFEGRILGVTPQGLKRRKLDRQSFLEAFRQDVGSQVKLVEDAFATDTFFGNTVGTDFLPLLGGPFYKNLYYYTDYIRMHAEAFYSYHHDPIARAIVQITRDFVLGTGYEIQCDMTDRYGKVAMAIWKAFEQANDLQEQMDQCVTESSIYGESIWWWLPSQETKIVYQLGLNDPPPRGIIPRIRLVDPSNIVEIVTYPEDMTRPLFYVWLAPTQYQIYTTGLGSNSSAPTQPTLKYIYQQIPADQMMHFKINAVSNEKRGRSDLFPVFGYLKRLRDSVNYSIITLQKVAAWAMDTEIDGDQTDIDQYIADQKALETIPDAGSEFVHSTKIKRTYSGNTHAGGHTSDAFQWCFSMICAGVGIPMSYFGTHISGGQTRASAIVATEPVAKKMEKRREIMKRILRKMWNHLMTTNGLPNIDCNIIFPEIITQDRSQKLKDLLLMQQSRWVAPETAASIAAKEMQIQDYDYNGELEKIKVQLPEIPLPLMDPGKISATGQPPISPLTDTNPEDQPSSGFTSQDRNEVKRNDSTL